MFSWKLVLVVIAVASAVNAQLGPGNGPWQIATPESQGLSLADLEEAEERVNDLVPGRVCYVVIKNGYLVYERYRSNWNANRTRAGWSTTKSHCSSMFGIATQHGWANPNDLVSDRNGRDVRNCNEDARFEHVLTMTGESRNIDDPSFSYDTDGTQCLDTLSDFIDMNNPDRLSTKNWKDRYWQSILGMENFSWEEYLGYLHCGYTSETSCRDLARAAQLWVNEGAWPGAGQVMARSHALTGRTHVFPDSGEEYGYTVWLQPDDPVDEEVHSFLGMYSQCAHISKEHEAIVVSMGDGDLSGARCFYAWTQSREAVVSSERRPEIAQLTAEQRAGEERKFRGISHEEILAMRDYIAANPHKLTAHELNTYNDFLIESGEKPLF